MELVLYSVISWLIAAYLFTTVHKKEVIRSIIIYFLIIIFIESSFDIISLNLQLIRLTKVVSKFLSFLLIRDIIMPFLIIICVNLFYTLTTYKKAVPVFLLIVLITLLDIINLKFEIYTYVKWNLGLSFIFNAIYITFALIIGKCINVIQLRSEHE